ncbi:MAG: hypothetical protein K9N35_07665 [Candidatus Marinimicrobia bacterium]|nr:hypothetical protein [Candidatus Neomarinimicrobiota bacterium]
MKVKSFILNKYFTHIGAGIFLGLVLTSCYNNTHIRTQRILEPGEKVFSVNSGIAAAFADNEAGYQIEEGGIGAFRFGVSYLGVHGEYEQGLNVGYSLVDYGDKSDIIVGYDIRKVESDAGKRLYRKGFYIEANMINGGDSYESLSGTIFQIRPYLMTCTSEQKNWYGGIHGLFSLGNMNANINDYYYSGVSGMQDIDYQYSVISVGAGVSFGNEARLGNILFQTQIDMSMLSQNHNLLSDAPDYLEYGYEDWEPFKRTGPVIGLSTAIRIAPPRKAPTRYYPSITNTLPAIGTIKEQDSAPKLIYDPFTGQEVSTQNKPPDLFFNPETGEEKKSATELMFDPVTGEPVESQLLLQFDPVSGEAIAPDQGMKFDPETGYVLENQPAQYEAPYSLLTLGEQSLLLSNGLKIKSLNAKPVQMKVLDITNEGLFVVHETNFRPEQEVIPFDKILQISFEGGRKGMSESFGSALSGCGSCVGIALGVSLLTSDFEAMYLALYAPVVGLGTWIYSSTEKDAYHLIMTTNSTTHPDGEYREIILLEVIRTYLQTRSFPQTKLNATGGGRS